MAFKAKVLSIYAKRFSKPDNSILRDAMRRVFVSPDSQPIRFARRDGKSVNRDFRYWTSPKVAILGADQKERASGNENR